MKWLIRLIPSSLRKLILSTAMDEIRNRTNVNALTGYVIYGVDCAITSTTKGVSDERIGNICEGCRIGGNALVHLSESVHPSSENGRSISEQEGNVIKDDIVGAIENLVPQSAIDEITDKFEDKMKEFLYLK